MTSVYNCLIADDNVIELDTLEMYLSKINTLKIAAICRDGVEAAAAISEKKIDIVFTDIDMPGLSGLELKQSLSHPPVFIFISSFAEYAAESYRLDVIDFVTKPVTLPRLLKAIQKAIEYIDIKKSLAAHSPQLKPGLEKNVVDDGFASGYFFVKDGSAFTKVDNKDLLFIESMGNFSRLHTVQQKKLITLVSLKNIEPQLQPSIFLRVHRQYIVNLHHIDYFSPDGELKLSNGETIPTGAAYKPSLLEHINARTLLR